jgi:hypothetical protein
MSTRPPVAGSQHQSSQHQSPQQHGSHALALPTLGDAAFLACSWTWCIGMFLPVLLLRDMGPWSFAAFALPNCIGAALLAWWMRGPARGACAAQSFAFVRTHRAAMLTFSGVTIAFQCFFFAWFAMRLGTSMAGLGVLVTLILAVLLLPRTLSDDGPRRAFSLGVLLASALLLVALFLQEKPLALLSQLPAQERPLEHVWPLLAVCVLGFGCSPFLDGTFHTILQRSASQRAKPEFAIAFLLLFPLMILGTLAYAIVLLVQAKAQGLSVVPANLPTLVLVHMALQLGFTLGVHGSWARSPEGGAAPFDIALAAGLLGAVLALFGSSLLSTLGVSTIDLGMLPHEVLYRVFLAFYGLVVPLYVLGCCLSVGPFAKHPPGASLVRLAVLVAGGAIATAFYTRGFILRDTPQLWIGVGIVIVSGLVARLLPGPKPARALA